MKYLANVKSGLCFAAGSYARVCPGVKGQEFINGNLIEITGYQKGENKAIVRKLNKRKKIFEFKVFTQRQHKVLQEYLRNGWELRKDYDNCFTYDEMAVRDNLINRKSKAV